jgi:hypothetical protein
MLDLSPLFERVTSVIFAYNMFCFIEIKRKPGRGGVQAGGLQTGHIPDMVVRRGRNRVDEVRSQVQYAPTEANSLQLFFAGEKGGRPSRAAGHKRWIHGGYSP